MGTNRLTPASTYRVQLSCRFTLDDLAEQVPYLAELGITDIYLSPIYSARPESPHCYDIVDYQSIDPQIGGCEGWRNLCGTLQAHSLGAVLDVVPNHMAADPVHNLLWRRMLREGPSSSAAQYFDVDWRPLTGLIRDKVLLPVLEEPYGVALRQGRIQLEKADGELRVRCGSLHLPLTDGSVAGLITEEAIQATNADPQRLDAVLEAQHYRLAYWKAANDEINYRRFFDVNELVAIRPENDDVFLGSHQLILRLAREEVVHGLRIDHVDGLLDPARYLRRLRDAVEQPMWIVVEKILGRSETLDPTWPVEGTTGYDSLNVLNRLFISGRGVRVLRHFYQGLVDDWTNFGDVAHWSKRAVMEGMLRSGLTLLAHSLKRAADSSWMTRDVTLNALSAALVEFIACLPVYRTYLGNGNDRGADRDAVEQAFTCAIRRNPSMDPSALAFLRSLLLNSPDVDLISNNDRVAAVKRFQQYTSGVHAKGIEDTAYYRDNALLALNEVGGDPGGSSGTADDFHWFNEQRLRRWPETLNTTSTHDTKLGEDTRMRIASLTVFASKWVSAVRTWTRANAPFRQAAPKGPRVDPKDEYRLYQVLVGIWPAHDCAGDSPADSALVERTAAYMKKAVREAQVHTSWMRVNEEYEAALDGFVRGILTDEAASEFRRSLRALVQLVLPLSLCHSISQLVLKCLMPGVPDIYQGDESWALCVTDPDNRQPVDFHSRLETLRRQFHGEQMVVFPRATSAAEVLRGDLKQYVATRLLRFRRAHRRMMAEAGYVPIRAHGARAAGVIAFRRTYEREHLVVAVPRQVEQAVVAADWPTGSTFWTDTRLPVPPQVAEWTDILSAQTVSLERRPVAQLGQLSGRWPWIVLYGQG